MKFVLLACLLGVSQAGTPITRVVELLNGLSKQIQSEGEKEENLFETYVCWAKSVIDQKTASNAVAASRIDKLEAYIADLDAGRIELTTERADLEKEIEGLMADMEISTSMRKKEKADFTEAEAEMTKAIAALKSASEVLDEATKDHKKGVLMAVRARLNGGMAALTQQSQRLQYAVQLGERFLTKADSSFLRRLLTGDVPKVDWKKLNRKATFKMAYKARSGKIQDVLSKMSQTFNTNLAEATAKEADAQKQYETLSGSKKDQLDAAQSALSKMESENGARGMTKQQSQDEVDSLKTQVSDDEKFIKQTETALAKKKEEWKARSVLRAGELEAISKAISIIHSDDARDNFKRSFKSQGLMELSSSSVSARAALSQNKAAAELREAAMQTGDQQLLSLATLIANPSVKGKFGPVIDAIDKMVKLLQEQEAEDLSRKQDCEKDRMADTREAIEGSREIDDMTDAVTRFEEEIKTLGEEITTLVAEHKQVEQELSQATKIRNDEHASFLVTDKDDKEAAETVKQARAVLENFYKDNGLVFAQNAPAGEAPLPPPATWEAPYGGKKGESTGIIAILGMVLEDIEKDIASAKAEEDSSLKEFDTFKSSSEDKMKELTSQKEKKEGIKGDKEMDKTETQKQRGTKKGLVDAVMKKMKDISPNCEYYEVNYPLRTKNRQIEIDGLHKAKAILQGGQFSEGGAFLQRRH